jgi:hypothetical protein
VAGANPLSIVKIARRPSPRSSLPRNPQRLGTDAVLMGMRQLPAPAAPTLVTYSTPVSTTPYSVTPDGACAKAMDVASIPHSSKVFFSIIWSRFCFEWPVHVNLTQAPGCL